MKKLMLKQKCVAWPGVTSLLVVLAIGMVLTVMVAGIAALTIREQRQASNVEQSSKALQLAEIAIKRATNQIVSNPYYVTDPSKDCPVDQTNSSFSSTNLALEAGQEIVCVEATDNFEKFEGKLEADRASQFMAGPSLLLNSSGLISTPAGKTPYYMMLKWHNKDINGELDQYFTSVFYRSMYQDRAAAIELSFIFWKNGNISPIAGEQSTNLRVATVLITPGQSDKGYSAYLTSYRTTISSICEGQAGWSAADKGGYACAMVPATNQKGFSIPNLIGTNRVNVSDFASDQYNVAIRVKPRYRDTNFELQLFDELNNPIKYMSNKKVIDVTARSGNLYRRVKAEVPLNSVLDNVFDSALYAGKGNNDATVFNICKKLVVNANTSAYESDACSEQGWQGP